jgi:hypothetical protein
MAYSKCKPHRNVVITKQSLSLGYRFMQIGDLQNLQLIKAIDIDVSYHNNFKLTLRNCTVTSPQSIILP